MYHTTNPEEILTGATNSALREVVSSMDVNDVISTSRSTLHTKLLEVLNNNIMNKYDSGIEVRDVVLGSATVPEKVKDAYIAVAKARAEKTSYINQGLKYKTEKQKIISGIVSCMDHRASIYEAQITKRAEGDVARFDAIAKAYQAAPEVTRDRLYLDNMQDVLSHTTNIVMDNGNNNMVYLPLDKLMQNQSSSSPTHAAHSSLGDVESSSLRLHDVSDDLAYCQKSVAANLNSDPGSDNSTKGTEEGHALNNEQGESTTSMTTASANNHSATGGVRYGE